MITKKMNDALNRHLASELYSSYLYMAMSAYASHKGWNGAANWLAVQAEEERIHVKKVYDYIEDHNARVLLGPIEGPPADYGTMLATFEAVLEHEQKVTALINELMSLAVKEGDHATETFLQWFITEQIEEEKSAGTIIDKLRLAGDTGVGAFIIDNELATRTLAAAPAAE